MDIFDRQTIREMVRSVATEWGANVTAARQITPKRELTQEELADAVGVSLNTIKRIETGEIMPRDKTRWAIAHVLQKDPAKLFPSPARDRIKTAVELPVAS